MPLPPKGIAVSTPGRESWLADEVLDTLIPLDPEARVEETGFRGVLLVYSRLDAWDAARAVSRGYHSFMKRFTPAVYTTKASSMGDVEGLIIRALEDLPRGPIRLLVSVRGEGKAYAGRSMVESLARSLGFTPSRRARMVLAVESVGDLFIAASGITGTCGPSCVTVLPP